MAETIEAGYIALIFMLMLTLFYLINTINSNVSGSSFAGIHNAFICQLWLQVTLTFFYIE